MENIEKFMINVPEKDIDLLHQKIDLTRWPDEINNKWSHGTDLNFLKELTSYWRNKFNWRDHEKKINEIGSYRYIAKSGLKLHFLHSKSEKDNAIPLVMTHGWPGSIQEFLKIIPIIQKNSSLINPQRQAWILNKLLFCNMSY
jgi:hypothetical protein